MNPIPDDELLSAYLDDEVDEVQRAHVEQLLAEQPEWRQRYDDLRALRGGFEALPKHRLPDDFAARVLRAAERSVLSGDGTPPTAPPTTAPEPASPPPAPAIEPASRHAATWDLSWQRAKRPLIWASLALAAGLLIMVYDRGPAPHAGRDVAFRAPVAGEAPPATASARPADATELRPQRQQQLSEQLDERARSPLSRELKSMPPDAAAGAKPPSREESVPPAPAPAGPAAMPKRPAPQGDAKAADLEADQSGEDRVLVVVCDVSEQPAYREEFRRALAEQQIAWEDSGAGVSEAKDTAAGRPARGATFSDKRQDADEKEAAPVAKASRPARQALESRLRALAEPDELGRALARAAKRPENQLSLAADQADEALPRVADAEVVLVEADPQQLEAVLRELDDHPEIFSTVEVQPAPDVPEQQPLNVYSRRSQQAGLGGFGDARKPTGESRRDVGTLELSEKQAAKRVQGLGSQKPKVAARSNAGNSDEPGQANAPTEQFGQRRAGGQGWAVTLQAPASATDTKAEKAEARSRPLSAGAVSKPESNAPSEPASEATPAALPERSSSLATPDIADPGASAARYRVLFVFRRAAPLPAAAAPPASPNDSR